MAHKKVLSVGQCGYDDSQLAALVKAAGGKLERAADAEEAHEKLARGGYALVLVNRVFDADGGSGVEFIGSSRKVGITAALMLVSDYADAQKAAVAKGAVRGFGKSQLGEAGVVEAMREAMG